MKGSFFVRPLEWNIEVIGESWQQGDLIKGILKVKNHGNDPIPLEQAGVGIAHGDIKKVHSRVEGALKPKLHQVFAQATLAPLETLELPISLKLDDNCSITDKKASYYLIYGQGLKESHLQLNVVPKMLFGKIIGLMDTFQRFKLKDVKSGKSGVEYKLLPPTSREMANVEGLTLTCTINGDLLGLDFEFQVKKLDNDSVTTKFSKVSHKVKKELSPRDYSLGKDMINQDQLLKVLENVLLEVKMKNIF